MPRSRITISALTNGQTVKRSEEVFGQKPAGFEIEIPAAKAGLLTTRTDDDTGTLTMDPGHGITTGAKLDVYWTNADGTRGSRVDMTVGTVSGNTVPIDLGTGDNLPIQGAAIRAMVPVIEVLNIDAGAAGVNISFVTISSGGSSATVAFYEGSTRVALHRFLGNPPQSFIWTNSTDSVGATFGESPFATVTAAINTVRLSHDDTTRSRTLLSDIFYD